MTEPLSYQCPFCNRQVQVGQPCQGCSEQQKAAESKPRPQRRSWEQDPVYDGLDLPDQDFDYDDFLTREFGKSPHRRLGVKWYWWLLGVFTLASVAVLVFRGFFR
jgi:hypothetical protein